MRRCLIQIIDKKDNRGCLKSSKKTYSRTTKAILTVSGPLGVAAQSLSRHDWKLESSSEEKLLQILFFSWHVTAVRDLQLANILDWNMVRYLKKIGDYARILDRFPAGGPETLQPVVPRNQII
jgi:hypothetical protein